VDSVTQVAPDSATALPTLAGERIIDFDRLREALVEGLARAVVVEHAEGRDGMGEVGTIAALAEVLDRIPGCDDAEVITAARIIRVVRTSAVAVAVAFPRTAEVQARLDEVLPVDLEAGARRSAMNGAAAGERWS
jgi:hypothetical protein